MSDERAPKKPLFEQHDAAEVIARLDARAPGAAGFPDRGAQDAYEFDLSLRKRLLAAYEQARVAGALPAEHAERALALRDWKPPRPV